MATLQRISIACGYDSLPVLIQKNVDYIIDTIIMNMKFLHIYPQTPQVHL